MLGLGMMKSLLGQCQAQVPELGHPELWLRSWCPRAHSWGCSCLSFTLRTELETSRALFPWTPLEADLTFLPPFPADVNPPV